MIVAGVDIGSTTAKAVIMRDGEFVAHHVLPTGVDCDKAAWTAVQTSCQQIGISEKDIEYIVATGYGRRAINFGNESITEITANSKGAFWLGSSKGKVQTIIDIGGQDTKAISLDENGNIINFVMNDKCAAGTGRFMEVIAKALGETIDDFAQMSLKSDNAVTINSTCTVFAESEVISLIAKKEKKENIIKGIHNSVASRIVEMVKQVGLRPIIFFDGGGAKNIGLQKAIEEYLGTELFVTERPQIVVALGAAVIAEEKLKLMKR